MNELALRQGALAKIEMCAGCGGGILGGMLVGQRTVCAVEIEPYRREVLLERQRDGHLEPFPIYSDARTFDGRPWRGRVDLVSGGFPCQNISLAGNGEGVDGDESKIVWELIRVFRESRAWCLWLESSPALTKRGLDRILYKLAESGCDAVWRCLSAAELGAPHVRDRIWILAYTKQEGLQRLRAYAREQEISESWNNRLPNVRDWWEAEPGLVGIRDGVADWVDRIRSLGDGQVPGVAARVWRLLVAEAIK